jgi:asparagine synthase (glutamine-hydrolysing)
MCGIAGTIRLDGSPESQGLVEAVVASQRSRGPDHEAVVATQAGAARLVLGHSRLKILDLSSDSDQPLWDHERKLCLVYNGEVYNYRELRDELVARGHRFGTVGDTEVILEAYKAWGTAAFERFNGMFAFGMWDCAAERFYLVRDRFGIKPLYYCHDPHRLYFASTCDALACRLGLEPDLSYAARGIRYWVYDDDDRAPFAGLRSLRPGHFAVVDLAASRPLRLEVHAYYSLTEAVERRVGPLRARSEDDIRDEMAALLERAIVLRMRSDVPVGVSLSGGLDSSVVAAICGAQGQVTGFTFGHPEDAASEGPMVRHLSRHTGLAVHFIQPGIREIIRAYFGAIAAQGAPFPTGSIIGQYLVYGAARERGVKVVLGGQGGDEVFMGYRKYEYFHLRQLLHQGAHRRALAFLLRALPDLTAELPRLALYWKAGRRYSKAGGIATELRLADAGTLDMRADLTRPLWERQVHDILHTSLPTLLRYEDRNSMAHGVESRLPYLDHELVEFALALDVSYKLRNGRRKWILRDYARGRIPQVIRMARAKRGFDVQQSRWIDEGLGEAIRSALHERMPLIRPYLAPDARIERMFADARLKRDGSAFTEATTLIWLGDCAARTRRCAPGIMETLAAAP